MEAGLSTTSPAAILLAISADKTTIRLDNIYSLINFCHSSFYRLCRNVGKYDQNRHTDAGRYPELTKNTVFRVVLCLHGMTKK
jgi:hypothetical protein